MHFRDEKCGKIATFWNDERTFLFGPKNVTLKYFSVSLKNRVIRRDASSSILISDAHYFVIKPCLARKGLNLDFSHVFGINKLRLYRP